MFRDLTQSKLMSTPLFTHKFINNNQRTRQQFAMKGMNLLDIVLCAIFTLKVNLVSSFHVVNSHRAELQTRAIVSLRNTATSNEVESVIKDESLDSAQVFQDWFEAHPKTFRSPVLGYSEFCGGLRGLSWLGNNPLDEKENKKEAVARIPRDITLQADFADRNWDVSLALQLCQELEKGPKSHWSGYFALLPDQPAPNAIRHWTDNQRHRLDDTVGCKAGQKLVEASDRQLQRWRRAYEGLSSQTTTTSTTPLSLERFEWAMETVNSRAFCGLASTSGVLWRSVGAPLLASATAWSYVTTSTNTIHEPSMLVLSGLAMAAVFPTILQIIRPSPELVYMLPLLDLANHREEANSSIQWDPIRQHFSLFVGQQCLVTEDDDQTQVYFNYGSKSDAEWLLNFGFLPSVSGDDVTSDDLRRRFAEEFVRRNSNS